jgi:hypothetical protein
MNNLQFIILNNCEKAEPDQASLKREGLFAVFIYIKRRESDAGLSGVGLLQLAGSGVGTGWWASWDRRETRESLWSRVCDL